MRQILLIVGIATLASGCMSAELARVRRDIAHELPHARVGGAHAFAFGRLSLGIARSFVGGDEPVVGAALAHIRSGAVGQYPLDGPVDYAWADLSRTVDRAADRGWQPVVVAREDSSATWVLARADRRGSLADLMVWTLDDEGLTLVRVTGRLDAIMDELVASGQIPNPLALASRQ